MEVRSDQDVPLQGYNEQIILTLFTSREETLGNMLHFFHKNQEDTISYTSKHPRKCALLFPQNKNSPQLGICRASED